jgi:HAE1 family hydrophobic/amphiphilic exporter-1
MFKMFIRRPVLSIVVSLILVFIGTLSLFNLPVTQYPSISPPKVNVVANYPGANNELLIKSVVIPLEQALNGVPGMKYIESDAGNDGEGEINVVFKLGPTRTWMPSTCRTAFRPPPTNFRQPSCVRV